MVDGSIDRWAQAMTRDVDPRRLLAAHVAATSFYRARLPGHLPALAYLHSRGVSAATANGPQWAVGYAPAGWTELRDALHAEGFPDRELLAAGLATTSRTGAVIDVFRDRVMFPVRNRTGDVVGFTSRDLSGRPDTPKYRNTITTAIYRKKRLLYGLAEQLGGDRALGAGRSPGGDRALGGDRAPGAVLLVEGPSDVLAVACLRQWLPWPPYVAVAPCGTALSADQVRSLRDSVVPGTPLVVAFDADAAGADAADRAYRLTADWPGAVDAVALPPGTDPAALVARYRHGAVPILEGLRTSLVELVVDHRLSRFRLDEPEGRVNALRAAAPLVAEVGERDTRQAAALSAHLSARLGLDPLTVYEAVYPALPAQ
jgi:DNA primase